jgi:ketosteroid isomerase-like protein
MKADAETEAEVKSVLDRFAKDYENRDIDDLLSLFAPDSDVVMFGTGADEKRVGLVEIRKQAERDWSRSDATAIKFGQTSISAAGSVAWLATDATFMVRFDGQEYNLDGRATGVLEKRDGKWLLVQGHFSVPSGGQSEGEPFPT